MTDEHQSNPKKLRKSVRILLLVAGTICTIFGAIGIVLPVLPTTPFLLLAAACYLRSSRRFYNWLVNNGVFGYYIRNYIKGKGIPLRARIVTITLLWGTILLSIFVFVKILWVQVLLLIIAIAVSIHIILIRPQAPRDS